MIVTFSVGNFLSFSDEQSVSFRASADTTHRETHCVATRYPALPHLTRTALIVGANGIGKSNFLLALKTMRDLVLHSTSLSPAEYSGCYQPFGLPASTDRATEFRVELLLEGVRYDYAFSYDSDGIVSESIHVYENNKPQRWFSRHRDGPSNAERWGPFSPYFHGPRESWRKSTRPQVLFLTTAAQLNCEQLRPIMRWFEHQVDISLSTAGIDTRVFATRLKEDAFKAKVLATLQAVDIPVTDVRVVDPGTVVPHTPALQLLYPRPGASSHWVDVKHDAAGVQSLMSLLTPVVDGTEEDRFVVIDDFDTHLHPLVGQFLVRLINEPTATRRRVQVLLVSHTTALMDLNILRRDEIWLMTVDKKYASQLTSFVEQRARKHGLIAKAYLQGHYGALPRIDMDKFRSIAGDPRKKIPAISEV